MNFYDFFYIMEATIGGEECNASLTDVSRLL